ncbi:unnamed protein product [Cyclocybe aegerita]|uniref:F-box domain-containing protein n=1 Tax=Cyclocybe aegerita TaxID=1973307 RepID=A0A8S0W9Z6_CYCAE|nr:unnamed protein product [Cyclocybe aegerita]
MSEIPQDLCEFIIDFLHADRRALAACSLVARSWLCASRYHLFRSIKFDSANAHHFLRLLDSACATFPYITRTLHLCDEEYFFPRRVDEHLIRGITSLSTLKAFKMTAITWSGYDPHPHHRRDLLISNTVTQVELGGVEFDDIHDLVCLICGFGSLQELRLEVQFWDVDIPYRGTQRISKAVRSISIRMTRGTEHLLGWLSEHTEQELVTAKMGLHRLTADDLVSAGSLVRKLGDQLRELELSFDESSGTISASYLYSLLDLSMNTRLERLQLHLDPRESIYQACSLHGKLALFISRASASLMSLRLDITTEDHGLINWGELAATLDRRRFSKLRDAAVVCGGKAKDLLD